MTQSSKLVRYETVDGVATITIDRPEKLNALSPQVFDELEVAIDRFEADAARVAVLTGAGRAFVAGADIGHYVGLSIHEYRDFMARGRHVQERYVRCPKLLIAAVEGYALGGGLELALCCDFIVAASDAKLGLPEVKLGLLPGGGGTQRLTRIIGARRALDLIVTGRTITSTELEAWGVINRVVEPGRALESAVELARVVARRAPRAVRLAKRLLRDGAGADLDTALTLEHAETAALYTTKDAQEGISAFVEKRDANFTDE